VREKKKNTFLRRYGSMAAMLAIVLSLGAIALSGGIGSKPKNDAAYRMFDADMKAEEEIAPAEAAPVPSSAVAKGSASDGMSYVTADSATGSNGNGAPIRDVASDLDLYGRGETVVTENQTECLEPPAAEEPQQFDPPDHATIHAALRLVFEELGGSDAYPNLCETDYYYCLLERTENTETKAISELKLEYAGLSDNGKYLTFALKLYTQDKEVGSLAIMNNYAVSRELDAVICEYAENRSDADHIKAYRQAVTE